jgi:hypothetical protein
MNFSWNTFFFFQVPVKRCPRRSGGWETLVYIIQLNATIEYTSNFNDANDKSVVSLEINKLQLLHKIEYENTFTNLQ